MGILADYVLDRLNAVARNVAKEAAVREHAIGHAKAETEKLEEAEEHLVLLSSSSGRGGEGTGSDFPVQAGGGEKPGPGKPRPKRGATITRSSTIGMSTLVSGIVAIKRGEKRGEGVSTAQQRNSVTSATRRSPVLLGITFPSPSLPLAA